MHEIDALARRPGLSRGVSANTAPSCYLQEAAEAVLSGGAERPPALDDAYAEAMVKSSDGFRASNHPARASGSWAAAGGKMGPIER